MNTSKAEFFYFLERFPALRSCCTGAVGEKLYRHFCVVQREQLAEPMDYFKYRLYAMERQERLGFVTRRQFAALCQRYNRHREEPFVADKASFIQKYRDFLGRDALAATPETRKEFERLCARHPFLLFKPLKGGYGAGIHIVDTREPEAAWAAACENHEIVEEVIQQHDAPAQFHPSSVNTVRTVMLLSSCAVPVLVAAAFRCGVGGAITDNGDGLFAAIDVATGVVRTPGTSPYGVSHARHPDSGVPFEGFQIPHWQGLVAASNAAALRLPGLRLVCWDWALRVDGRWVLIEGNLGGGLGPCQAAAGRGLMDTFAAVLGKERIICQR